MSLFFLLTMPLITALIGWLTNKVAIVMLFQPRRPLKLPGFELQGLIPRRQADMARNAAELIEREIFERHLIRQEIQRIDLEPLVDEIANRLVYQTLGPKIARFPLFRGAFAEATLQSIHKSVLEILQQEAPRMVERLSVEAERRLDVRKIVEERIAGFDLEKLEKMVKTIAATEFRSIELMGGILGFIVGLIQLAILALAGALNM